MSANRVGRPAAVQQQQQTEPDADETIKRNRLICLMVSSGVIVVIGFCMIWSQVGQRKALPSAVGETV